MKHRKKFNISGAGLVIFGVTIGKIIFSEENIRKTPPLIQAGASFAIPILIYVITYIFSPKDLIYVKCIAGSYMIFAIPQSDPVCERNLSVSSMFVENIAEDNP